MGQYNRGDSIEVKLIDNTFTPYFKGKAELQNKKEMKRLVLELKAKGVDISYEKDVDWFG